MQKETGAESELEKMSTFTRIAWALRKSRLPVAKNSLVLDVGSGGTPYPRSDVLLDRLTGAQHRCGDSMLIDRPAVFGDAQKMPFKDKAFDFIVASHLLEHMPDPGKFISELQRVGKAGYIETPNALFERLHPYDIHCLEVMCIDGVLHLHKKSQQREDPFLGSLCFLEKDEKWRVLFFERLEMFHVRLFWNSEIKYVIHNPEVSSDWIEHINQESPLGKTKGSYRATEGGWRKVGLSLLNRWYAMGRAQRLRNFNLLSILCCPECHGSLTQYAEHLACATCNVAYLGSPYPDFTTAREIPRESVIR